MNSRLSRSSLRRVLGLTEGFDALEADAVLDAYFKSSVTNGAAANVKTFPAEGPSALICTWAPTLTAISSVEAGPALTPNDVERLEALVMQARTEERPRVAGQYVFMRGEHRWRWSMPGRMQLFTAPSEGTSEVDSWTETPLVLQVNYRGSSIPNLEWLRAAREVHFWIWTIGLLLLRSWRVEDRISRFHWVRLRGEPDRVVFAPEHAFGSVQLRSDAFFETNHLPPVERVGADDYYRAGPAARFALPSDLEEIVGLVDSLSSRDRSRLAAAGFWVEHARSTSLVNPAAEFAALVTAVEALIEPGSANATRRFVEFFTGGTTDPEATDWLRDLYDARSRIVHGWDFVPDTGRLFEEPRGFALGNRIRQMERLLPRAVRHWLAATSRSPANA